MIAQPYHCSLCGPGSVNHASNAGVSEVCTIIKQDHRKRTPGCTGRLSATLSEQHIQEESMAGNNGSKTKEPKAEQEAPEFQQAEQPEVRREYTVQSLKCKLTRDEKLVIGQNMSDAQRKIKELEAALKSAQKQIQADITAQKAIMDGCADKINSGYEFRNVRCEVRKNRTRKTIETIRLDTYEVTQSRQMTKEEQQELPLEPGSEEERVFDELPLAADANVLQEV